MAEPEARLLVGAGRQSLRLLLWPALTTLAALCVLLGLGVWQVPRLAWKTELLAAIDQVEVLDLRAEDACPDHWRHVGNRITAGETPRAYTRERHAAWLLRRRITA